MAPADQQTVSTNRFTEILSIALCLFLFSLITAPQTARASGVAHEITAELLPDRGEIRVSDRITVREPRTHFDFALNAGFQLEVEDGAAQILQRSADETRVRYRVTPREAARELRLSYRGKPHFKQASNMGGMPQGDIGPQGVYLDGSSAWYPRFDEAVSDLDLTVSLPQGWKSLSVGRLTEQGRSQRWQTRVPHDDLYLLAGRYARYARQHNDISLSVWLLDEDQALAERYLGLMGDYIDHYAALIGDYPFAKFAVVENRWQTGYGMPSFTLLGSRVLRLPFIPYTSLPHEILHNWLGNGVWVDYRSGNWSEGLTAYLSDHWMKERRGAGSIYRVQALQRYTNFAAAGDDRPLVEFVSRHDDASQSIGYSKSLMVFHMLRRTMGDRAFTRGLQRLWRQHRYTRIGFSGALKAIVGERADLAGQSAQWLHREGAPRLRLLGVDVKRGDDGYRLALTVEQGQAKPFTFMLPIAVTLEGQASAKVRQVRIERRRQQIHLRFDSKPLRVDIDPAYDVLRQLDPSEQPPALNRLFGQPTWLILPSDGDADTRQAWQRLAQGWKKRYRRLRIVGDNAVDDIPDADDRLILGWQNRALPRSRARFERSDQRLQSTGVLIDGTFYDMADHAAVLVNNDVTGTTTGFIGARHPVAIDQLNRKLPHYGSFARLLFDDQARNNIRKERLTSDHSALGRRLGPQAVPLRLPPEPVLGGDRTGPGGAAISRQSRSPRG